MSNICDVCDESYFRCKCAGKAAEKETKAAGKTTGVQFPCVFRDPLDRQCGLPHRFTVPRPGMTKEELSNRDYLGWLHYCDDHYDYERPYNVIDEAMDEQKKKLEAKYGKFDDHRGKDINQMAAHCLKIMYEMGGQAAKVAKMLERSLNKARREEKASHG